MKIKNINIDKKYAQKALLCVALGTISGLFVYELFLYFKIAIFGWNLGLLFAPLVAGYVETILSNRIIGKNLGAISAFILFVDTVVYSFILKNPSLGINLITIGSIFIILQAAFPTLINHILLVVFGGILSRIYKIIRNNGKKIKKAFKNRKILFWNGPNVEPDEEKAPFFDEFESNENLNSLNFFFLTSSDIKNRKYEVIDFYQYDVFINHNKQIIDPDPEIHEKENLILIKKAKDECLLKLAQNIENDGGNGILNLTMHYNLIGIGGDDIQVIATGIGIQIDEF